MGIFKKKTATKTYDKENTKVKDVQAIVKAANTHCMEEVVLMVQFIEWQDRIFWQTAISVL